MKNAKIKKNELLSKLFGTYAIIWPKIPSQTSLYSFLSQNFSYLRTLLKTRRKRKVIKVFIIRLKVSRVIFHRKSSASSSSSRTNINTKQNAAKTTTKTWSKLKVTRIIKNNLRESENYLSTWNCCIFEFQS